METHDNNEQWIITHRMLCNIHHSSVSLIMILWEHFSGFVINLKL